MSFYNVNIFASFDSKSFVDPQQSLGGYNNVNYYFNTVAANQTCQIISHPLSSITQLAISSNGIDSFNIYPVKYQGERVNFVAKLKDSNGFDVKDYPLLPLSSFTFNLIEINGNYLDTVNFNSNFGPLSSLTQGGFFKGFLTSPLTANNYFIKAVYTDDNLNLTGYSSTFSLYSSAGAYNIRKINENFDQTAAFQSLAYQPALIDKPGFFDTFLGQIVGDANSDPDTLGIKIYEKISNYVSNLADIEYCNVDALKALLDELNTSYQNFDYQYPASLQRLIDILSVKHKLLIGQPNQYQNNFDDKGYIASDRYGLNKGNKLDINSTIITPDSATNLLVTFEKFSGIYNTVNKMLTGLDTVSYPLSDVNDSWGWNLVLPNGISGVEVGRYYDFYEFIPVVEGSFEQEFIDYSNANNTLTFANSSYQEFTKQGGVIDNVVLYNLLTNLQVLSN